MARKPKPAAEMSDGEVADAWGAAKESEEAAGEKIDALKAEFEARGLNYAAGEAWQVFKDVSDQERFDVKAARAALGADGCRPFLTPQKRTSYRVKPKVAACR
jgi:hypothetical protein